MMASDSIFEAAMHGKQDSQDSQLILEALRAELGVPSVSVGGWAGLQRRPRSRPLQAARTVATGQAANPPNQPRSG